MSENLTSVLATVRQILKDGDSADYRWTDDELIGHINHAVYDISLSRPRELKTVLSLVNKKREVDISSLEDKIRIRAVEYQVDRNPRIFRLFKEWENELTIDIDTVPDVTETLLTGTVTFTNGSKTVTGSGTAFSTKVKAGEFIKKSTDSKWHKVASVTSDTVLVLEEAYDGITGADVANSTPVRDYTGVVRLYWEALHSISATTSTLPAYLTGLLVDGATAYASISWANYAINRVNVGGGAVDMEYLRWANNKLAKYYSDLRRIKRLHTYKDYPTN